MSAAYHAAGRTGYEAYAKQTGGKTFDGRDMPTWDELPDRIKDAWAVAAQGILEGAALAYYGLAAAPEPEPATPENEP